MNQPRVSVEIENDRLVGSEQRIEVFVGQTVRMFLTRLQLEKVDNVNETDLNVRKFLPQHCRCSQGLLRGDISGGSHHQVGLACLVVTGPVPDADAFRAVRDGFIHIQILQVQLFVRNDYVDVVLAAQAVIGYRQQAVGVRREINARYCSALVQNHVQKTGVLMREPVVILPPDRRRDQQVQRGYLLAPGQMIADG